MNYWLVKSEPEKYAWDKFVKDGKTTWDGVRNYAARNFLRDMKKGDLVFYYHSNEGKEIVGLAKVSKEAFQDPTTDETAWLAVSLKPYKALKKPVPLSLMKTEKSLKNLPLIRIPRLSVMSVSEAEYETIMELAGS